MKTVFIINPEAGQGKNINTLVSRINSTVKRLNADAEIYITKCMGDAEIFVKNFCEKHKIARFIACGGDGTLSEVLNGVIGFCDAEVGVIPQGTGNDFCRNFGTELDFNDISYQILGESIKCDAIRYTIKNESDEKVGYCANMFNIGFDCNVADLTQAMKQKPFISGSLAYFISILFTLIKKKCSDLKIELDGKVVHDGKLLLTSIANGCYCGGGIKSNPYASVQDGFININIINNLSRLKFISLLPSYMKGTVFELKNIEKYISTNKCKHIKITPNKEKLRLCVDGEIIDAGETQFEILRDAFNFVIPEMKKEKSPEETVLELI